MTTRQTVTILNQEDRHRIATWAKNVEVGTVVTFRKKSRSTEQSAKMWAMLNEVSNQVEWYGQKIDAEDWKDMFTASLRHARVVPGIDKGTFVPLGMRTSTMTIDEMTNLIELIYAFGAEHNVTFKEPKQDNTNTDEPAPHSSVDAGLQPAEGEMDPTPSVSPSNIPDDLRHHFIDFARKAINASFDETLATKDRMAVIDNMEMNYRDVIPSQLWPKLGGIKVPCVAAMSGKRSINQVRDFIANDAIGCKPSDLGGVDG